jgi:hypothetical protein
LKLGRGETAADFRREALVHSASSLSMPRQVFPGPKNATQRADAANFGAIARRRGRGSISEGMSHSRHADADESAGVSSLGLFRDFRLTLAFLRWRSCAWITAFINRSSSGLIRYGNRIAFVFGTRGAYGCAGSAGCISVGRMRDAESQSKKDSGSN